MKVFGHKQSVVHYEVNKNIFCRYSSEMLR